MTREEILETLEDNLGILRGFGVKKLGLFGSYACGDADSESDLDFVVELEDKTFDAYMGLKEYLEELFGLPVDLVIADTIKPRLRKRILQETQYAQGL